jgi:hypothetical protein
VSHPSLTTGTMNAYLQRADDFIQQQIYKYEQKRQGRDYAEMYSSRHRNQQHSSRAQTFGGAPPQGPPAPQGWSQEFDQRSQRWYYIEHGSGRSQWDPPAFSPARRGHRSTFSEHRQSQDHQLSQFPPVDNRSRAQIRDTASPHVSRSPTGYLGIPQPQRVSTSPHPSPHGRLPPGTYLDTKTGQVVTNMFPPDHLMNAH